MYSLYHGYCYAQFMGYFQFRIATFQLGSYFLRQCAIVHSILTCEYASKLQGGQPKNLRTHCKNRFAIFALPLRGLFRRMRMHSKSAKLHLSFS
jgi:hypothetical protein